MSKKYFTVNVPVQDLKEALMKVINSPHKDLISSIIIESLEDSPKGLQHVYISLSGLRELPRFKYGDTVLVNTDYISTYRVDKSRFKEGEDLHEGKLICTVVETDVKKTDSICVTFDAYDSGASTTKHSIEMWLDPDLHKMVLLIKDFPID